MFTVILITSLLSFGIGRGSKVSHETLIIEKCDGSVELRENKSSVEYEIHRDMWGTVDKIEKKSQ